MIVSISLSFSFMLLMNELYKLMFIIFMIKYSLILVLATVFKFKKKGTKVTLKCKYNKKNLCTKCCKFY